MPTQAQIALNMIQQLRLLDPAVSAEVGTPERKIIDTVAEVIAERQIDINQLSGIFDLDSKFGDDLDQFLSIFGFGRQKGAQAIGFVTFSRTTPSVYLIPIPIGTQVTAVSAANQNIIFTTFDYGEIPAGELSVIVPVRCVQVGVTGNVATGAIQSFASTPVPGITTVNNEVPTHGGVNPELDAEFKVRFKNTAFRNLAGTQDQFLAVAVSTANTTKANVVGPISRYKEYIQVPDVNDATNDPNSGINGNGSGTEWTSALSTIPYSKHVYTTVPYFISSGDISAIFYHRDIDFSLNLTDSDRDRGDTYRGRITSTGPNVNTDSSTDFQPNITFFNIYGGIDAKVQALRPADIVLFEHSYMSSSSRNDFARQILNCVDVFVNGENPTFADTVRPVPNGTDNLFVSNFLSPRYSENFRRKGEPERRPVQGNVFTNLFWSPITDLPDSIKTSDATYYEGTHYWIIQDVSDIGGTVRARDGIEWNPTVNGRAAGNLIGGPYTGPKITATADTSLVITGYQYDRNIIDLQTALDANKQVTTDVLGHRSTTRYFKLDITVMYVTGASIPSVNSTIHDAVQTFFDGQYFGTVIQMSDLLQAIHSVNGVDNVRWSRDLTSLRHNVVECDVNGHSITNALIDRRVYGTASATEVQQLYLTSVPTGGHYTLTYQSDTTANIAWDADATAIQAALTGASIPVNSVTGAGTPTNPFILTFATVGARDLITVFNALTSSTGVFDNDFFLKDHELPSLPEAALPLRDTLPGLIIRPRAQNTWSML